ncbi:hypothetical protein TTHERM_002653438, partial (macronuclear) [Tetrahymena thermophila SB210]
GVINQNISMKGLVNQLQYYQLTFQKYKQQGTVRYFMIQINKQNKIILLIYQINQQFIYYLNLNSKQYFLFTFKFILENQSINYQINQLINQSTHQYLFSKQMVREVIIFE